jgi:hypothetical protein
MRNHRRLTDSEREQRRERDLQRLRLSKPPRSSCPPRDGYGGFASVLGMG